MGFEIFIRTMQILNEGYVLIAKALYSEDEKKPDDQAAPDTTKDILSLLKKNNDEINITISKAQSSEDQEDGSSQSDSAR